MTGIKYDSDKPDYSLLTWNALEEVTKVLTFGAKKYSRENWRFVEPLKARYIGAGLRHIVKFMKGEIKDSESGCHHLAHATVCLMFILEVDLTSEVKQ